MHAATLIGRNYHLYITTDIIHKNPLINIPSNSVSYPSFTSKLISPFPLPLSDKAMEPQKGYLRRIAFFVFEMWFATVFALLILFALASIGRSLDMLEKSYFTEIGAASPGDSIISQGSAEVKFVCWHFFLIPIIWPVYFSFILLMTVRRKEYGTCISQMVKSKQLNLLNA